MQKYYQNERKFNSAYSRNTKIEDWARVINLDKYKSREIHFIAFYVNDDNVVTCFVFEVEYIPKINR